MERERFVDPQSGAPQQHDQRTKPVAVGAVAGRAHHRDDLLDRRRISRILLAFVSGWTASVVAGHGHGRSAVARGYLKLMVPTSLPAGVRRW